MPCRFKNRHKGRNHTHAVKPDSKLNLTPVPGTYAALPPLVVAVPAVAKAPRAKKATAEAVAA